MRTLPYWSGLGLFIVACASTPQTPPAQVPAASPPPPAVSVAAPEPPATAAEHAHPHWSYSGAEGPEHWAELEADFAACKAGKQQTPIDLPATAPRAGTALVVPTYPSKALRIVNNGHTVQVDESAGPITFDGVTYNLAQFHFHSPSEHTVAGKQYDAEMHMVHKSDDGKLLVVGLLFTKGKENAVLKAVWDAMPMEASEAESAPGVSVNIGTLFGAKPRFWHYTGSLTTPPCSEGVTWFVVEPDPKKPLELSEAQLTRFRTATHGANNRPVQPREERVVDEVPASSLASH